MTVPTERLPAWTVAVPFVALGTDLALHGRPGALAATVLVVALVAAVLAAVHHAEVVALRVGEPFGAILLALAVTVIELGLIVSIMLGDQPEPTLTRDTIHAVVVLVLHGIAGLCIVVGALRHREQEFRVQGAQAYLIVLLPMVAITLVLPNFTTSARISSSVLPAMRAAFSAEISLAGQPMQRGPRRICLVHRPWDMRRYIVERE
jgi:Ca2+:H+ antiporter